MTKQYSDDIGKQLQQAHRHIEQKEFAAARQIAEQLGREAAATPALLEQIGNIWMLLGEHAPALRYYATASAGDPANLPLKLRLAACMKAQRQSAVAERVLNEVLAVEPDNGRALALLGGIYLERHEFPRALEVLERAAVLRPRDASIRGNMASVLNRLGDGERALQQAEAAYRLEPGSAHAAYLKGMILMDLGQLEEAGRLFRKAVTLDPCLGVAYDYLARSRKFLPEDRGFIEKTEAVLEGSLRVIDRITLHYAVGKMYDDLGEADKAFAHYRSGATLGKPAQAPQFPIATVKKIRQWCTSKRLLEAAATAEQTVQPVFIVGMPRSGTTLTEQIIASYPGVAGAGELPAMAAIAEELGGRIEKGWLPGQLKNLPSAEECQAYAARYLEALREGRADALRITDKLPGNFAYLGLIKLLLPKATIIHVKRHPLDTCLSCYFQWFEEHPWTRDMQWLADFYRQYRTASDDWESTLPAGSVTTVHYESLVQDTESEARRLIAACGLEWDPRCLDFTSNRREVKTASVWQVRQPVYQTSRMRWVKYARHLGGLAYELRDYLGKEDLAIFAEQGVPVKKAG